MGGTRRTLIRFVDQFHTLCFQFSLQLTYICERFQVLCILVPARVEGQHVLLEHPLEKTDYVLSVFQDYPVLRNVSAEDLETKLLVKSLRSVDILHCQTD